MPKTNTTPDTRPVEERYPNLIVSMGLRLNNGKLALKLAHLESDGTMGHTGVYSLDKATRGYHPGQVYRVRVTNPDEKVLATSFPNPPRWERSWDDDGEVAAWQAASRSAAAVIAAERRAKSASGRNAIAAILEPIRREYQRALPAEKIAMEIVVLSALRAR